MTNGYYVLPEKLGEELFKRCQSPISGGMSDGFFGVYNMMRDVAEAKKPVLFSFEYCAGNDMIDGTPVNFKIVGFATVVSSPDKVWLYFDYYDEEGTFWKVYFKATSEEPHVLEYHMHSA